MRFKLMMSALASSIAAMTFVTVADAAEGSARTRAQAERRSDGKNRPKPASRDNSHTVRANSLDPARTYGEYPDWARVALSPKYGGRSR